MKKNKILIFITCLILIGGYWLCGRQRIYAPKFDPSPISSLKFKNVINSVNDLPFNPSYVYEKSGPEALKAQSPEKKEYIMFRYKESLVIITLFYNSQDALKKYNSLTSGGTPVFSQHGQDYDRYFVEYVSQGRADQFGLFLPIDSYNCSAGFLKQNMVVYISSDLASRKDGSLDVAVRHIGNVLAKIK